MVDKDELKIILGFIDWIKEMPFPEYFLVTKNGKQFDIPFILARTVLFSIKQLDSLKILSYDHFDLQEITSRRISLQSMAELLNCTPKSGTGSNAIKLWNEKRYKELMDYCAQDVLVTEEVFLRWKKLQNG